MQNEFQLMVGDVTEMVQLFQHARFVANVSNKQVYDSDTHFNENNVTQYLAELEEYISSLITLVAHQKDEPNAVISAIDLENLNQKYFKAKEMQIDPPVTYEFGSAADMRTELGDEQPVGEEDVIIDSKKLYKNFMSFVENQ